MPTTSAWAARWANCPCPRPSITPTSVTRFYGQVNPQLTGTVLLNGSPIPGTVQDGNNITGLPVVNDDGTDVVKAARVYGGGLAGWLPGNSIVFLGRPSLNTHDRTLTVLDLRTNEAIDLVTAERISGVGISPDGSWLAYYISFSSDDQRQGIWVQRTDGSDARKLDMWGAYQWRDESHLLVIPMRTSAEQAFEIWEVNAVTGEKQKLTDAAVTALNILNGDWRVSPDGKSVVFVNSADRNLWLLKLP